MSRLSEISFEPLEPYDGKLSCTVLRGERGSNAPDLPDLATERSSLSNHYKRPRTYENKRILDRRTIDDRQ